VEGWQELFDEIDWKEDVEPEVREEHVHDSIGETGRLDEVAQEQGLEEHTGETEVVARVAQFADTEWARMDGDDPVHGIIWSESSMQQVLLVFDPVHIDLDDLGLEAIDRDIHPGFIFEIRLMNCYNSSTRNRGSDGE